MKPSDNRLNIDDQITSFMIAAINASQQALIERKQGTIAGKHLPGIARRLAAACDFLILVQETYENAT